MNNEATKILNENQNEGTSYTKDEKKDTNLFGQGVATAAGAAVGTGAAMAAGRAFDAAASASDETDEVLAETEDVATEETAEENVETPAEEAVVAEEPQAPVAQEAPAPQVTTVNHVVTVRVEVPQTTEASATIADNPVPVDAEYVDESSVEVADAAEDNEVHVVGAVAVDNEEGGQAILMGLEASDGDRAVIVDIDSDGTIDYLVHDDNHNQQIEENEVYDVHDEGWQTEVYLADYAEQQAQQDIASNDDMPDYMNDADAGMMDV